ncbi:type IV secretory system conjugative DNA transfer family protein [Leadbetterella sp. DM7]|uniref:type IV secretory system conjugative DNA transfer family protein n=1 Tax=Leadbetterella sp. DM7 TaxID=3235085 RepID=UPI00349EA0AF
MGLSQSQALTTQFYDWEIRGRGWMVTKEPIDLEPPFHPFFGHSVETPYIDDGKHETFFSRAIQKLFPTEKPKGYSYTPPEYIAFPALEDSKLVAYRILYSKHTNIRIEQMEQLYKVCVHCSYPISFELVGTEKDITSYLICGKSDAPYLYSQLKAFFPSLGIQQDTDYITQIIDFTSLIQITDFGLAEEFMRPLAMSSGGNTDSYTSLFGVFEQLQAGQRITLQILFKHAVNDWTESIITSVSDENSSSSFFIDAPEMPRLASEKVSSPILGVCVRLIAQATSEAEARAILSMAAASYVTASQSPHNHLLELIPELYPLENRMYDVLYRTTHRFGMLLNIKELCTLAHFPTSSTGTSKLIQSLQTTKAAPSSVQGHTYVLGKNIHHGQEITVSLSLEQRLRHTHIIGVSGSRKSSFMLSLITQDIAAGHGFAVFDPHGDLIESILPFVPKERIKDVVLIDPNDPFPVGLNILSAHSDIEREVLASDLVAAFKRFSTSWGDQMNSIFANTIIAFLENTRTGTIADVRRFLIEKDFREQILRTVTDPAIVYYWQKEFPLLKGTSIASILTRLDTFLRPKLIRQMVSQKEGLNFQALMDENKIILMKLSEGIIGAENSYLLGTFIVSKLQQAAMARQAIAEDKRKPFFMYLDEFQHFITPSLSSMLTGVRKYSVGLVLAHQNMEQIAGVDSTLAAATASAYTRICFRLGDNDAKRLAGSFHSFAPEDFLNLPAGQAIVRAGKREDDFSLIATTLLPSKEAGFISEIIQYSRNTYSKILPVEVVAVESPALPIQEIPSPPPTTSKRPTPPPKAPTQHRYYQLLIKKVAESQGYKASLEMPTPDGKGRVDILLERNGESIAVEISETTDAQWEIHNIQKCIAANYTKVFACVEDIGTRQRLRQLVQEMQLRSDIVSIGSVQELITQLQQKTPDTVIEERKKGYRVKVQHKAITPEEAQIKRAIIESIAKNTKP